jgi:hypothetical protein
MKALVSIRLMAVFVAINLSATLAWGHGFDLRNVGGTITAENNDPPYQFPNLFGHALDVANATLSRNQADHGSIDADRPGSGFTIPGDTLQMELLGPLWFSDGGLATLAPAGVVLSGDQKVTNANRTISAAGPVGGPLTLAATSSHEMIWSLPFGTPEGAYGLSYRITGNAAGGAAFTPSVPLVLVLTTPGFTGDVAAAERSIYAATVPEPGTLVLAASAGLAVCSFFVARKRGCK